MRIAWKSSVCLVWCTALFLHEGEDSRKGRKLFKLKSSVGTRTDGYKLTTCSSRLESRRCSWSMRESFGASSQSGESWTNIYLWKTELPSSLWLTRAVVLALQLQMPPSSQYTGPGYVIITLHIFLLQNINYVYAVFCYYAWFGTYYEFGTYYKLHHTA